MNDAVESELAALAEKHGKLTGRIVVDAAGNGKCPAIHAELDWDNDHASDQWRCTQARRLIVRVKITVSPTEGKDVIMRAYTSLAEDRIGGEGYISTIRVLGDAELRASMVRTALKEFQVLRDKYEHLEELASIMDAIDDSEEEEDY